MTNITIALVVSVREEGADQAGARYVQRRTNVQDVGVHAQVLTYFERKILKFVNLEKDCCTIFCKYLNKIYLFLKELICCHTFSIDNFRKIFETTIAIDLLILWIFLAALIDFSGLSNTYPFSTTAPISHSQRLKVERG